MLRLWRRWFPEKEPDIKPPRQLYVGSDESLQAKARARREIADSIKRRSALVASWSKSGSLLKIARNG